MLNELLVEGLGVIERAEATFNPRCSVLTGETGTGKTLVVVALSTLLGGKADRDLVREGASEARVEARFTVAPTHPAVDFLSAHGIVDPEDIVGDDVELVFSRSLSADGKSGRARVNGRLASIGVLAGAGATLVEIASQHQHQQLGRASHQRGLLDAFAGPDAVGLAREVSESARAAARARRRLEELVSSERERRREADALEYEIAEIAGVELRPGESEELGVEATRLEHAEALAAGITEAAELLGSEEGAIDLVARARSTLESLAGKDADLAELAARLEAAALEIDDIARDLTGRVLEPDPARLDAIRGRLAVIGGLRRKYGDDEEEILAYLQRARERLAALQAIDDDLDAAGSEADEHEARAERLADRLTEVRREAAPRLEREMASLLAELALDGARLEVELEPRSLYDGGKEAVDFLVSANPGEPPRPISKVASGGELSRIALALRLVASSRAAPTMVFDEVDAGVGGRAARSVGRALSRLARSGVQVLVVTHLPQVAAFADHHLRVVKEAAKDRTTARVEYVDGDERVAELSRMLAGLPESERAREHAQELLTLASDSV